LRRGPKSIKEYLSFPERRGAGGQFCEGIWGASETSSSTSNPGKAWRKETGVGGRRCLVDPLQSPKEIGTLGLRKCKKLKPVIGFVMAQSGAPNRVEDRSRHLNILETMGGRAWTGWASEVGD